MLRHLTAGLVLCAALSACGGAGSTGSTVPQTPTQTAPAGGVPTVSLSIRIPAAPTGAAAAQRRPLYVSVNTQSAAIAVNGASPVVVNLAAGSPNCVPAAGGGRTCSAAVSAPVGTDTFAETLYASTNGSGPALAQSTTSATIAAGKANVVNLVLDGVVASIGLTLVNPTPPVGTAATLPLTVNAYDASGAAIIGNDPFVSPIALSDSDTSGVTKLSATTLASPAAAANVTVAYTGAALSNAVITASASGVTAATATIAPGQIKFNDYATFGYDNARDVFNPNSTAITPTSITALHLAWQSSLGDYNTQTQPILATEIPGHAGVLFVGGGSGAVYGYDALSGAQLWRTPLGQMTYDFCGGGTSYFGIGGTPAYDPSSKSLYVVDNSNPSLDAYAAAQLYHLDAGSGNVLGQVNVTPTAAGPGEINFSHTAVTLNNGIAYLGTGSTCDISSWRGRVAAVSVPGMSLANTFFTVWDPNNSRGFGAQSWGGGGIWGWGGVALDPGGNVLTGVGNADTGDSNGKVEAPFVIPPQEYSGFGDALLELSSNLGAVLANNHPVPDSTFSAQANDLDVQGTPVVFRPNGAGCGTMVAIQGKSGEFTFYNEGSINGGPAAQYQLSPLTQDANDAYLGDPSYSPATGLVYAPVASSTSPTLFAPGLIAVNPGCGSPSVAWHAAFGSDSSGSGTPRAVPAPSAGGVVFAGTSDGNTGGYVWAVNASTGVVLNGGNPVLHTSGNLRMPPTIDGNWIFVIDNNGDLYGLTIDPSYAAIQARYRAPDARQVKGWGAHHRS